MGNMKECRDMKYIFLLALALPFLLSGCGGDEVYMPAMTPAPVIGADPSDEVLFAAISEYLAVQHGPKHSQYDYARVDLDGDKRRDALVLYKLPHTHWCGWGGCMMSIFRADGSGFTLVSDMTNVRGPLVVSDDRTDGWRDIVVTMSGTNIPNRQVAMRFTSNAYPPNPMDQPEAPYRLLIDVPGMRFFE
jgi:hypothetical protein